MKCDYNKVIVVLFPVLLYKQNCFICKIIVILKQINKPRFKNLLVFEVLFLMCFVSSIFFCICMLNLSGSQLFLHIVILNEFRLHKKRVKKHCSSLNCRHE